MFLQFVADDIDSCTALTMSNSAYSGSLTAICKSKSPLLQQVRDLTRLRHMSIRTEDAYVQWIERFLRFHRQQLGEWRHPIQMGSNEVNQFLTYLATERHVAASTQNQALCALLFLFRNVLRQEITLDAKRAKKPQRLPVVLSIDEVRRVLVEIPQGPMRLIAGLLYGAGLRLMEACRIRVKDVDFDRRQIIIRDGKGEKDRAVPLPTRLVDGLTRQLESVRGKRHCFRKPRRPAVQRGCSTLRGC